MRKRSKPLNSHGQNALRHISAMQLGQPNGDAPRLNPRVKLAAQLEFFPMQFAASVLLFFFRWHNVTLFLTHGIKAITSLFAWTTLTLRHVCAHPNWNTVPVPPTMILQPVPNTNNKAWAFLHVAGVKQLSHIVVKIWKLVEFVAACDSFMIV